MIVYIVLAILVWLLKLVLLDCYNDSKKFLIISFICITIVLGFRGNSVGVDTYAYSVLFDRAKDMTWSDIFASFPRVVYMFDQYGFPQTVECFYVAYCKIVALLFGNFQWSLIITAIIISIGFGKFIYENCDNVFLGVYVFLCESIFINSFNLQRQIMAMAIVTFALPYIREKRMLKAGVIIMVASLFHNTMLLCMLLIPVYYVKNKRHFLKIQAIITVAFPVLVPVMIKIVSAILPRYAAYFSMTNNSSARGIWVLWLFEFIIIILSYFRLEINKYSFYIYFGALLYFGFELLGLSASYLSRVSLTFAPSLILLFDRGMYLFEIRSRKIYCSALYLLLTMFYLSYVLRGSAMSYTFFWQ